MGRHNIFNGKSAVVVLEWETMLKQIFDWIGASQGQSPSKSHNVNRWLSKCRPQEQSSDSMVPQHGKTCHTNPFGSGPSNRRGNEFRRWWSAFGWHFEVRQLFRFVLCVLRMVDGIGWHEPIVQDWISKPNGSIEILVEISHLCGFDFFFQLTNTLANASRSGDSVSLATISSSKWSWLYSAIYEAVDKRPSLDTTKEKIFC